MPHLVRPVPRPSPLSVLLCCASLPETPAGKTAREEAGKNGDLIKPELPRTRRLVRGQSPREAVLPLAPVQSCRGNAISI